MAMHRVGFVAFANFGAMGLAALSTFEHANLVKGEPVYEVTLLSQGGGSVRSSAGFSVMTEKFGDDTFDTLIVGASTRLDEPTPAVVAFIRQSMKTARRIATSCTGAFALAEAGVLNGRRATTHWQFARELAARYPKLAVDADRIFVVDGPIWTSAGVTATIDLALAMVEKDLGAEIARAVARKMVVYHRRAGGQSQFSTLLELEPKSDRIQTVFDYAGRNLKRPLSVDELATAAALSPRQFSRVFRAETGQSPARAVERLRVEAARVLIEQGRHTLDAIAEQTGFGNRERMRRAFLRTIGQPPQTIRRNSKAV
jgi:transcriptional regulator GlxA family with amidase domain